MYDLVIPKQCVSNDFNHRVALKRRWNSYFEHKVAPKLCRSSYFELSEAQKHAQAYVSSAKWLPCEK